MARLSSYYSNINSFTQNKHEYETALKNSGYKAKLVYKSRDEAADVRNRKNRPRKTL